MIEKAASIQWGDWPRQVPVSTYLDTRDRYVERISACADVVAVFQLGEVSVPGLSDIDVIAVVKEKLHESTPTTYALASDDTAQYCFSHAPYIVPSEVFKNLERFWWTQKLTRLTGIDLSLLFVDGHTRKLVELSLVIDYVPLLGSVIRSALGRRAIPVRKMLLVLNSLRHSIKLLAPFERVMEWERFSDHVFTFRSEFFTLSTGDCQRSLLDLMHAADRCSVEMLGCLDSLLQAEVFFGPVGPGRAVLEVSPTTWYRFSPDWNSNGYAVSIRSGGLPQRLAACVHSLPPGLIPVYETYASVGGPLSERIHNRLKIVRPVLRRSPSEFEQVLREKVRWAERQACFLRSHGFPWGQMALYPFYRPPQPLFRRGLERALAGFHRLALR